jgi:hypothetical protein
MKPTLTQIAAALTTAIVVGALLYIGGINPKTGVPDPITVDGQTIEFTWTDDNTDEDLHIYTDQATYTNGLSHATVYVAVANRSGVTQDVELMAHFRDTKKRIEDVKVLTEVTKEIAEPIYTEKCDAITKGATSSECYQEQIGTTTRQEANLEWVPLDTVVRTPSEVTKEQQYLESKTMKSVEGFIATKKTESYTIPADGVVYYKVNISFPANEDDNFYFAAIGNQGAAGTLDPWFNSSWPYRVKIEVNPAKVGTTTAVTNFPVYLDLAGMPNDFWTNVSSTGADIRMVESDETTETAFELVSIATTTKRGELHFLADSLSTTSTSTFYLYYGNPSASAYAVTDTYGRNNVWAPNYIAVYHMNESSGSANDSTASGFTLTNTTGKSYTDSSLIGRGIDFGSATRNTTELTRTSILSSNSTVSMSLWFKLNTSIQTPNDPGLFILPYKNASGAVITIIPYWSGGTPNMSILRRTSSTVTASTSFSNSTSQWYHVTAVYDSGAGKLYGYLDGQPFTTTNVTTSGTFNSNAYPVSVGGSYMSNNSVAIQDEVRVGTTVKSPAWVLTEYNNVSSTSTFLTIDGQTSQPVDPSLPTTTIYGGTSISGGAVIK